MSTFAASQWLTLVIVGVTILGIAVGRWPLLRANRTTLTLIGAALLLAVGSLSLTQAYAAIDLGTLLLLFSMMTLNAHLSLAGFFTVATSPLLRLAHTPRVLLALIIITAGVLSALFLNDTVVLLLTPVVVAYTKSLQRDPLPYLLGLATASNVGSVATITGNPQNIIIGTASGISYTSFLLALGPVAVLGLGVCWGIIVALHRSEFAATTLIHAPTPSGNVYRPLLWKTIGVSLALEVAFLLGVPVALAAFLAAAALFATRRIRPERIFARIDWSLLVFFAGIFVVTDSLEVQGLTHQLYRWLAPLAASGVIPFGIVTAVLSNLISNVPAVLLLQGLIASFAQPRQGWLVLAAASTLAGNLTLLGSIANLIVAEIAQRDHVKVSFWAYLRVGVPITVITLALALCWLSFAG